MMLQWQYEIFIIFLGCVFKSCWKTTVTYGFPRAFHCFSLDLRNPYKVLTTSSTVWHLRPPVVTILHDLVTLTGLSSKTSWNLSGLSLGWPPSARPDMCLSLTMGGVAWLFHYRLAGGTGPLKYMRNGRGERVEDGIKINISQRRQSVEFKKGKKKLFCLLWLKLEHYELWVSWFQLPLKWASWGSTEATFLPAISLSLVKAADGFQATFH